jgi:hypothetical protein
MTFGLIAHSMIKLRIVIISTLTLSKMTLSITTHRIMTFSITPWLNCDTFKLYRMHTVLLNVIRLNFHHADCFSAILIIGKNLIIYVLDI